MQAKNPIRIEGDTAYITLLNHKGEYVAEAMVDSCDVGRVGRHKWYANRNAEARADAELYVMSRGAYLETGSPSLHRFIAEAKRGQFVDHINHQPLDCRRANLRICTRSENEQNRAGAPVNSRTGARNVHWDSQKRRYRVRIWAFGKRHCFGFFDSIEDASRVAETERARLHGAFAS